MSLAKPLPKATMFTLILILLITWLGLMALLTVWTIFFQGYIYTGPVQGALWRGPAAGSAVTLFLLVWVLIDYNAPRRYHTLFDFEFQQSRQEFKEFRTVDQDGKEELFKQVSQEKGRPVYRLNGRLDGDKPKLRPQQVIVKENGEDVIFKPDKDKKDQFKTEAVSRFSSSKLPLYYRDNKKRFMVEGEFGEALGSYSMGNLILNLLLNFLHVVVWFAALWLLLEYRIWHAVGFAVVAWIAVTLFLLPPILSRAEDVADKRTPLKPQSSSRIEHIPDQLVTLAIPPKGAR